MTSVDVVHEVAEGLAKNDLGALMRLVDDGCVSHVPGATPISGDHRGKKAIAGYMGKMAELTNGTVRLDKYDIIGNQRWTVGVYEMSAERDGRRLSWRQVNLYDVRDGKILEVWQHPNEIDTWQRFWR